MPSPKPNAAKPDPDRNLEAAVEGTFPASDPLATSASQGARAVPVEAMLGEPAQGDDAPDARTVRQEFPDAEAAKLALEALIREAPLDRRCAAVEPAAERGGATLAVRAVPADVPRIETLLRRLSGSG